MSKVSDEKLHELLHRCKQRSGLSYQELDSLAEVCAELTSLRLKSEWRPIDSAPKDGKFIWVACEHSMRIAYWSEERWRDLYGTPPRLDVLFTPTHWHAIPELPPPPEGGG